MRHRATRLLHVLACAPVAVLLTVVLAPTPRALAAGTAAPPAPYVVTLDPGHGGSPDNAHPDQLFDPGAIGTNGLLEKDYSLDTARRARALLERDRVRVVLTRDRDEYLDIGPRMDTAIAARSSLFVSIHGNSWTDQTANGSVVLYPNEASHGFATVMSDALARRLGPLGVADDGVILRDNLWVHATMPAVTIEPMYLSNPREAGLLAQPSVRDAIAAAVRDAIEAQDPTVLVRKRQIDAWLAAHPRGAHPGGGGGAAMARALAVPHPGLLLLAAVAWLLWAFRRPLRPLSLALARTVIRHTPGLHPVAMVQEALFRRRRRLARRRRLLERGRRRSSSRRSVYDELWF